MNIVKVAFVTFLVLVTFAMSTCRSGDTVCGDSRWKENRERWQEQKILDYDFVVRRFHDPQYDYVPFLIKVRDGEPVYLSPTRENAGLELTDGYAEVGSVDRMFDLIKTACVSGSKVEVEYDKERGFPLSISITRPDKGIHNVDRYVIENFNRF